MNVDKVDNRPFKPDKRQWTSLGVAILIIVILIIWKLVM